MTTTGNNSMVTLPLSAVRNILRDEFNTHMSLSSTWTDYEKDNSAFLYHCRVLRAIDNICR